MMISAASTTFFLTRDRAVNNALASSVKSFGGKIQCDAEVGQIIVKGGRTKGVALTNGDEYYADIVVSNLDPKRTVLKIMNEGDLPKDIIRKGRISRFVVHPGN